MRRLLTVLLLACAAMGFTTPARAHNVLVGSDPADGATLAAPPGRITLVFDQPARQGYAQIGVTGGDGSPWADGAAVVSAEKVSVAVKPLPAGRYVVGYRILSSDGHPVTGKISFTVGGSGAAAPAGDSGAAVPDAGAAAAEAAANGGAGMAVVWIVAALLVLAAGTAVALRRSRSSGVAAASSGDGSDGEGPLPGRAGTGASA
ncbi:copper resistance CopC family protein [Nonomuraea sp. SBT364]|uniref:copper resistance CopC family protein n=1 Tax=Nonomuraea sp. SBT364 TaxID=1580530 RepID=UPI0007C7DCD1|nr:copper resistance CopC family protein [Nonomuraea sp. SBT364]